MSEFFLFDFRIKNAYIISMELVNTVSLSINLHTLHTGGKRHVCNYMSHLLTWTVSSRDSSLPLQTWYSIFSNPSSSLSSPLVTESIMLLQNCMEEETMSFKSSTNCCNSKLHHMHVAECGEQKWDSMRWKIICDCSYRVRDLII